MRYQTLSYGEKVWVLGELPSGKTVTITLYDLEDGSIVPLSSAACTEIADTGIYKWSSENIASQPTTMKQYLYVMSDGQNNFVGKLVIGGFPDEVEKLRIDVDAITSEVEFQRKYDKNKHKYQRISDTEYLHTIYDDDGTTVLAQWRITKVGTTQMREQV